MAYEGGHIVELHRHFHRGPLLGGESGEGLEDRCWGIVGGAGRVKEYVKGVDSILVVGVGGGA